jgi:hypothetical protein
MIDGYRFGRMVVDGEAYEKDLILSDAGVRSNWWRREGHWLSLPDIQDALDQIKPSLVVIGTGNDGLMKVDSGLESKLAKSDIRMIAEPTPDAVLRYNQSIHAREKVMGAFHLTC